MSDLYKEYIQSVCIWDIIESSLGAVLNTDASPAMAYINADSSTLSYPFSCIKILIDFLKDSFMQQVNELLDGTFSALRIPTL